MLISPAYAQSTAAGGSLFELLFPLVMVFAIIYFMILRPQQKRQREHANMVEALRRGDTVVTQGGLVGKVAKVAEDEIEVDIAENTRVSVIKSMIISVRAKGEPARKANAHYAPFFQSQNHRHRADSFSGFFVFIPEFHG